MFLEFRWGLRDKTLIQIPLSLKNLNFKSHFLRVMCVILPCPSLKMCRALHCCHMEGGQWPHCTVCRLLERGPSATLGSPEIQQLPCRPKTVTTCLCAIVKPGVWVCFGGNKIQKLEPLLCEVLKQPYGTGINKAVQPATEVKAWELFCIYSGILGNWLG